MFRVLHGSWGLTALLSALLACTHVVSVRCLVERDPVSLFRGEGFDSSARDGWVRGGDRSFDRFDRFGTVNHVVNHDNHDESTCDMCKQVVRDIEDRLNDPGLQDSVVEFLLDNVCPLLPGDASTTCRQEARVVVAQIAASIQQMVDVDEICVGLGACSTDRPGNAVRAGDTEGYSQTAALGGRVARPSSAQDALTSPWYCHGLDCPYFTVLEKGTGYEKRRYVGGTWASTTIETYLYALASPRGFKRLFNYIDEGNFLGVKIPMTSPVRVRMEPSCGAFCKQNFTVSFFMPKEYQSNPPPPLDRNVFIEKDPPATYYVGSSGGFKVDDLSIAHMANKLAQELDEAGKQYEARAWFVAGYDPPFRISDRHTEIWIREVEEAQDEEEDEGMETETETELENSKGTLRDDVRDEECDLCENVVEEVTEALEDPEAQAEAIAYAKEGCAVIGGSLQEACEEMIDEVGPLLIQALIEELVGGEDVCVDMGYCLAE